LSPNGKYLAVGTKTGQILILDPRTLSIINKIDVPKKLEVSVLKFSPDSALLACGIVPPSSEIIIYNTSKFNQVSKLKGNLSRVTHMDFSENGRVLQTNSTSYEILYYDSSSGSQLTSGASQNKDERWASWTCVIGKKIFYFFLINLLFLLNNFFLLK
jgi:WD40 repeat protein